MTAGQSCARRFSARALDGAMADEAPRDLHSVATRIQNLLDREFAHSKVSDATMLSALAIVLGRIIATQKHYDTITESTIGILRGAVAGEVLGNTPQWRRADESTDATG